MHPEIRKYDLSWPQLFETEALALHARIGVPGIRIEHIGSTAVPGLAAKPIVDILIGLPEGVLPDSVTPALLKDPTVTYVRALEEAMPFRRFFIGWHRPLPPGLPPDRVIPSANHPVLQCRNRRCHVHLVPTSHPFYEEHIKFRDLLRANGALRQEYENLKYRLASRDRGSVEDYTESKGDFIRKALG